MDIQQQDRFTIVSLDESFFFYDSFVRRIWIEQDKRPVVRVTGSHQRSRVFGAIGMEEENTKKKKKKMNLFRQYCKFNGDDTFLDYLKKIHANSKCYLFMDKASPHYTCKKVIKYFEDSKDTLIPISSNCITGVYGRRKSLEYSQARSTCSKILFIICRFKERYIYLF